MTWLQIAMAIITLILVAASLWLMSRRERRSAARRFSDSMKDWNPADRQQPFNYPPHGAGYGNDETPSP